MDSFISEARWFSIGHVPPRTPNRADAQVPFDAAVGDVLYGSCSHVYFRSTRDPAEATFGFIGLEVAIQLRRDGATVFELYCTADGFQSGRGNGRDHPLRFDVWGGDQMLASTQWPYPEIVCGQSDPLAFSTPITLSPDAFAKADRIFIAPSAAAVQSCTPPASSAD